MAQEIILNRLAITGPMVNETPLCVIVDVFCSHGGIFSDNVNANNSISLERSRQIINTIKSLKFEKVRITKNGCFENKDLSLIARYINSNANSWRAVSLIKALTHLHSYYELTPQLPSSKNFKFGLKTPEEPENYDSTMLYSICRYYGIKTTRSTTLENLASSVRLLMSDYDSLKDHLLKKINISSQSNLINMIMSGDESEGHNFKEQISLLSGHDGNKLSFLDDIRKDDITENSLNDALNKIKDKNQLIRRITPQNHQEAILLSAMIYNINITESKNPQKEYNSMREYARYLPYDSDLCFRYIKNPEWYNVKKTWTPSIPGIYDDSMLVNFLRREGYTEENILRESSYQLLYMSRITPTFYTGKHPYAENDRTPIELEDVKTLSHDQVVTYGISDSSKTLTIYKLSELSDHFKESRSYTNPVSEKLTEVFTSISIKKLLLICNERIKSEDEKSQIKDENQELINAILMVERYLSTKSEEVKIFIRTYDKADSHIKNIIELVLKALLDCSMYMRGWKVAKAALSDYPILVKQTQSDPGESGKIDLNVSNSIMYFEDLLGSLPDNISDIVKNLPLMRLQLNGNDIHYQPSNNENQGITIYDRIKIVKKGDKTTEESSCIRLSSNWLAPSVYYYMTIIGMPDPFNIRSLAFIS